MLNEKELSTYADVLMWGMETARKNPYEKGDVVRLLFWRSSYPLVEKIYARCIRRGYNVITQVMPSPVMEKELYDNANDDQLQWVPPWSFTRCEQQHGNIIIYGSEILENLRYCDPNKIALNAKGQKPLRDILNTREDAGDFGWSLAAWPSEDMAAKADMTMDEYFDQIKKACFLKEEKPVEKWQELYEYGRKVCTWLRELNMVTLHMKSASCDITFQLGAHRKFMSTSGHNIPSFEVFTSPDATGTNGFYHSDQKTFRNGNLCHKINLTFENGKCVHGEAHEGNEFLQSQLEMDEGSRYLGEFSLTDRRYSKIDRFMANTLFDENVGQPNGNCHIALGQSFPDAYSGPHKWDTIKESLNFNQSALHWDLINCEDKVVTAKCEDGSEVVIYKDGMFAL